MIEEQYVSFETAKMAKEKGFNEKTDSYYMTICQGNRRICCHDRRDVCFNICLSSCL